MSENKKIHLAVWAAWLALHGYLLCFRFSVSCLVVLALGALILLVSTFSNSKYEDGYLCHAVSHVLGASLFVQLGWCFVEKILPRITTGADWLGHLGERCVVKMLNLARYVFRGEAIMVPLFVALALFALGLCARSKPRLRMLASYAGSSVLMYPILQTLCHSHIIALLYTAVTLVFIWADLWNIAVEKEWNKAGKRWFNALALLLFFATSWDWALLLPLSREGVLEFWFVQEATRWYHLVAAGVAIAAVLFVEAEENCDDAMWADMKIMTAIASMLLLTAFLNWFHVGWWWVLVLLNVLYLLVDVFVIHHHFSDDEDVLFGSWVVQVLVVILSILAAVTGHFGTWPMLLALAGSAVLLLVSAVAMEEWDEEKRLFVPAIIALLTLAVLIPVITWLWMYRRLAYTIHMLLILAAAVVVIAGLLSWTVTREDRKNLLAPAAAVLAFVILGLNVCMTGGSRIDMELGTRGVPVVHAEARGEENQIVSTEYRWTGDWLDLDAGTFTFTAEEPVSALFRLAGLEGKLRVIVTDAYGTVTETIFWLHSEPQIGG